MGTSVQPAKTTGGRFNRSRSHRPKSPIDKAKGFEVVWQQVAPLFEAARDYANSSFVYVIGEEDDGPIKIGVSKDPIARLRGMQTGNPRRLRIEYVLVGDMAAEKVIHEYWEPFAVHSASRPDRQDALPGTEWFKAEIRDQQLLPIIADAVARQIEYIATAEEPGFDQLERIIRDAHAASGLVVRRIAPTVLLAEGAGYAVSRRYRI
jgi:hypothetical protein